MCFFSIDRQPDFAAGFAGLGFDFNDTLIVFAAQAAFDGPD
jgi:hypothetical protein